MAETHGRNWHTRPASEVGANSSVVIGLSAEAGGGKTYSALMLADALTRRFGGKVVLADTESGRALDYRHMFGDWEYFAFDPPYLSSDYSELIRHFTERGDVGCLIIDSASDEWDGPGGYLERKTEMIDELAQGSAQVEKRIALAVAAKLKPAHNRLKRDLQTAKINLILCCRAREKIDAKTFKSMGYQPIVGEALPYGMRWHLLMDHVRQDGSCTVLRANHADRHVFTNRVDQAAIDRLIGRLEGGNPKKPTADREKPPADAGNEEIIWQFDNATGALGCLNGDPSDSLAMRSLYRFLMDMLNEATPDGWPDVRSRWEANAALIETIPEAGYKALTEKFNIAQEKFG